VVVVLQVEETLVTVQISEPLEQVVVVLAQ
jgi:hypothetical protein